MRHSALFLGILSLSACIAESQQARPAAPVAAPTPAPGPDRSQQTLREIDQQRRWTAEALAARPTADELEAVRDGEAQAIADTRKRLRRLLTAVERTTWIREVVPEVLRASAEQDRLVAAFDAAARDRNDALAGAEAAAHALAGSRSRSAISPGTESNARNYRGSKRKCTSLCRLSAPHPITATAAAPAPISSSGQSRLCAKSR